MDNRDNHNNLKVNMVWDVFFFLPLLAIISFFTVICINIYLKLRRRFSVSVNCWFCNKWTKVPFDEYNSFVCPFCEQYNGFNKDGDYNKHLPEFSDELLNVQKTAYTKTASLSNSNGLCQFCNNNQQLKIYQLANFIPLYEENYDVEIEHFQKQLERAYKLCSQCERTVNSGIQKQNSLLGLNFSQLKKKRVIPLDFDNFCSISKPIKFPWCLQILQLSLLILTLLQTFMLMMELGKHKTLAKYLNPVSEKGFDYYKYVQVNIRSLIKQTEIPHFLSVIYNINYIELPILTRLFTKTHFPSHIFKIQYKSILIIGIALQLMVLTWKTLRNMYSLYSMVAWCLFAVLIFVPPQNLQIDCIKVLISSVLVFLYSKNFYGNERVRVVKKTRAFKKLKKSTTDNFSDNEDYHLNKQRSFKKNSPRSSTLNHSFRGIENQNNSYTFAKPINSNNIFHPSPEYNSYFENTSPNNGFNSFSSTIKPTTNYQFSPRSSSSEASLTNSFLSKKSYFSSSKSKTLTNTDLNISLNNLSLGNSGFVNRTSQNSPFDYKKDSPFGSYSVNSNVPRPKPIISPSKFQNPTQNSWVAGGFWRNEELPNKYLTTSPSRCSSLSSGVFSRENSAEKAFYSLPPSMNNSTCGEHERCSVASEPTYNLTNGDNNGLRKTFEIQRNGFTEWKPFSEPKGPQSQLNIALGQRTEPVMISESLYRTMPVNCSFPHFEHLYTNYYSGKRNVLQNNDLLFQKNPYNDFISNSPSQSHIIGNKRTFF